MLPKNEYKDLEKKLGYKFKRRVLLETALLHRSYRYENEDIFTDNQRLEFLGDAVLGFVIAAHLYKRYPDDAEGVLTSFRSQVTNGKALADIGMSIGVGEYIKMGRGEEGSGGRTRSSNLADAMESILGAAYLDGGRKAVDKIFSRIFVPAIDNLNGDVWADNPKGKLQDYSQKTLKGSPRYKIVKREGPPHSTVFTVEASLPDGKTGTGQGNNKQEAETEAAKQILEDISDEV
ncbi:ribonuclease III [bacterium E08(2017)]|nr:ribonuclease III [bacterium E08(2017)]